jgi:hypothetical protein
MVTKFGSYVQQWRNAAPSKVYEAKMPGISDDAMRALKDLDPHYNESDVAELEGLRAVVNAPPPSAATLTPTRQAKAPPAGAKGTVMGSDKKLHWTTNGKDDLGIAE